MKLENDVKSIVNKYIPTIFSASNFMLRGKMMDDLLKLIEKQEKAAYEKGYEAGRWDRSTNTSKPWREPD